MANTPNILFFHLDNDSAALKVIHRAGVKLIHGATV